MDTSEFVGLFREERDALMTHYLGKEPSLVSARIDEMELTPRQRAQLASLLHAVLDEAFYKLLMEFAGATNIGSVTQAYSIKTADGDDVAERKALVENAWHQFHSLPTDE
jgi:hypothetical protein